MTDRVDPGTDPTSPPDTGAAARADDRSWLTTTWPLGRAEWKALVVALVGVIGLFTAIGLILTRWTAPNAITDYDAELARSLADGRTESVNDLSLWASFPADTLTKLFASLAIAVLLMVLFKRWHEAVFVVLTLAFEAAAFSITTFFVGRPRPSVEHLLDSPVDTSFPSGHVAAATVWGAVAIVVFWHTRNVLWRALSVAVVLAIVASVAWARLYQGMHNLSDVIASLFLGSLTMWVVYRIMGRPPNTYPILGSDHTQESVQ